MTGNVLRDTRERLGWSSTRMASELGVGRATLYRWEAGPAPRYAELAAAELYRLNRRSAPAVVLDIGPPRRPRGNPNWKRSD